DQNRQGRTLSLAELCADCPERLEDLKEHLRAVAAMGRLLGLTDGPSGARPVGAPDAGRRPMAPLLALLLVLAASTTGLAVLYAHARGGRHRAEANLAEAERQRLEAEADFEEARRQRVRADEKYRKARAAVDTYLTAVGQAKELRARGLGPLRKRLLPAGPSDSPERLAAACPSPAS